MISQIKNKISSVISLANSKEYRTFRKLFFLYSDSKRFERKKIKFLIYEFEVVDALSFIWQFKEIFLNEDYKFHSEKASPLIYDCGSNVGLSCLYFKKLFPKAKIKAFEADAEIAKVCENNLRKNGINDVEITPKAVWIQNGKINFGADHADGGSVYSDENKIQVEAVRLRDLFEKENEIDFLKMDIEGAENEVVEDCKDVLHKVKNIFVEYHSLSNQPQKLQNILSVLSDNGFRYHIHSIMNRKKPFTDKGLNSHFDLQLNIFAYKN